MLIFSLKNLMPHSTLFLSMTCSDIFIKEMTISDKLIKELQNLESKSNYRNIEILGIRSALPILKSSKRLAEKYILNFVKATFQVLQLNSKFSLGHIALDRYFANSNNFYLIGWWWGPSINWAVLFVFCNLRCNIVLLPVAQEMNTKYDKVILIAPFWTGIKCTTILWQCKTI